MKLRNVGNGWRNPLLLNTNQSLLGGAIRKKWVFFEGEGRFARIFAPHKNSFFFVTGSFLTSEKEAIAFKSSHRRHSAGPTHTSRADCPSSSHVQCTED